MGGNGSDTTSPAPQVPPRLRNVRKKLTEIAALEEKVARGNDISVEQHAKLKRKADLEEELHTLEEQIAAVSEPAPLQTADGATKLDATPYSHEPVVELLDEIMAASSQACGGSNSETVEPVFMRSPSMRWEEDPVSVEDVFPIPKPGRDPEVETIESVQPFSAAVQSSERMRSLMQAVSALSRDAFEDDALEMVTRKSRWKLTLLACPPSDYPSLDGVEHPLIGFIVYRLRPELQCLSIAKVAIVPEHRRKGHGYRLIEWCTRLARKQSNISFISLSSLPEAVRFYQRLGFRKFDVAMDQRCGPDEDLIEGQVYMEKPIKGRGGRGKAGSRR
mmetsp:Transcript_48403/g.122049  ORF Transcript_48403/g.122049 Transcript_48403/m.122049 type:complete len:333 (+) Transcript_48403:59-1057(+)